MNNQQLRIIGFVLSLFVTTFSYGQYSMTETGITLTFDGFDASTGPLVASPSASQLDSDHWAVDLDNDNDFDTDGAIAGFGGDYSEGFDYTATVDTWDDHARENDIFSFDYNLDGILSTAPAIGMGVSANFATNNDALVTKIENTGTLEITDLEVTLDAFYFYDYEGWSGPANGTIGIFYFVSSTNITNDLSVATWTELETLTNNAETADGWKPFTTGTYDINGVSLGVNEYLYLKFVFSPENPEYNHDQALAMDNIAITPMGFAGTDATTTLVIDESGSSTTVAPTSSSAEIFRFDIVDDGVTDGYSTTFSELVISSGTNNTITDWSTLFETVTLTDETGGGSTTATIGTNTLTFSSLSFVSATDMGFVADGTSKEYSLTIDFVDTYAGAQAVDNEVLQFLVEASKIEIEGVSSTFQTANSIQTTSTNNVVAVTADRLTLQNEPSVVGTGTTSDVYFGFSLRTVDAAGHLDQDVTSAFTISETTQTLNSGGILTFISGAATTNFTNGVYTFSDLFFDTSGGYTVSFTSGAGYTATNFAVTAATSWRSIANGDWGNGTGTVWQYFVDGAGWTTAAASENPNATAASVGPIYIYHTVAIETTGYSNDQIFVESGGILDINNTFTINDDGTSEHDLTVQDGGIVDVEATVTITGTFQVKGGSSIAGGGIIRSGTASHIVDFGTTANGYWETYSILQYTADATIALTGNATFFPNAASDQYPLFEVTAVRYKALSSGGFTHTVNGILYYTDPDRLDLVTNNYVVRNGLISAAGSDLQHDNLTSMTGDTLFFSGNIYSNGADVDLTISNTAPSVVELLADVTSTGNDRINFAMQSGGTLILGDHDCDFGDFSFASGSIIKVSNTQGFGADQFAGADALTINTGTIFHFNGTAAQATGFGTLDGGTTSVAEIVVDNSAGLTLDSDLTITGALTFNQGIFTSQTTSPGLLSVASGTGFSGFSSTAHIQGPVSIGSFAGSKFVPIGDEGGGTDYYRPLIVDPAAAMTVSTAYTRSDPATDIGSTLDTDGTENPQALTTSGYYTITFGSTGTADVALYFDGSADAIAGSGDLIVAKYDNSASEWVGYASSSFGADYVLATVTIDDLADTQFTIASVTGSLLPVELINFSASVVDQQVVLDWATASEFNNDLFEIQRSVNAINFEMIGEVKGAGTSTTEQTYGFVDTEPLQGNIYYRLKQIDFDGAFEYSPIVEVNGRGLTTSLRLLGNPVQDQTLKFVYTQAYQPQIRIWYAIGREVEGFLVQMESDVYQVDVSGFSNGLYLLQVNDSLQRFVIH